MKRYLKEFLKEENVGIQITVNTILLMLLFVVLEAVL